MRDVTLLIMLLGLSWMALRQPWVGVLGLAMLSALHPQSFSTGWMAQAPMYKMLFLATVAGVGLDYLRARRVPKLFWDWRFALMGALIADFALTTHFALVPEVARNKLIEVMMVFPPVMLAVWLIDTREKFHYLLVIIAASIALVAFKGGYWAVMTGFQDRVYGPPGSQIGGNNEFALALAMIIPLLVYWLARTSARPARWAIQGLIAVCYVSALTSWSRGGLVALAAMTLLLVWHSRRKALALPLVAAGIAAVFMAMPENWMGRMESISGYAQDASFQGRQAAWEKGLEYVRSDLLTGSGFEGWRAISTRFNGGETPGMTDWHSAYVEVLVEHGVPGALLWGGLMAASLFALSRLLWHKAPSLPVHARDAAAMLRAALVAYLVGSVTLGTTYWELPYLLVAASIILSRLARDERLP